MAVRLIALNAVGGAQVVVNATQISRRVEIIEDESGAPQGLIYNIADETNPFTTQFQVGPGTEPIILGNTVSMSAGRGAIVGVGPQAANFPPTTKLWQGTSAGAATNIRVTEIS